MLPFLFACVYFEFIQLSSEEKATKGEEKQIKAKEWISGLGIGVHLKNLENSLKKNMSKLKSK
jgi:hypothetical protein